MGRVVTFEDKLFIVHAGADESFVLGHLVPATRLAPGRVMLPSALALGAITMTELERGVQSRRFTLVVLSPALAVDPSTELAELHASYASGAEGRLVPLLRADCEIPSRLAFRPRSTSESPRAGIAVLRYTFKHMDKLKSPWLVVRMHRSQEPGGLAERARVGHLGPRCCDSHNCRFLLRAAFISPVTGLRWPPARCVDRR